MQQQTATRDDQLRWIRRTRQLLQHLNSNFIQTSFPDQITLKTREETNSFGKTSTHMFNDLQDTLDTCLIQAFHIPQTSINYNGMKHIQVSNLKRVNDQCWYSYHWMDVANLYIPCFPFILSLDTSKPKIAHLENLTNHTDSNNSPHSHIALHEALEQIFPNKSNQFDTLTQNQLIDICYQLISQYELDSCIKLLRFIEDSSLSTLLRSICYLKSLCLEDALQFIQSHDNHLSKYAVVQMRAYCYIMLGQWNYVDEMLNSIDCDKDQSSIFSLRDRSYISYFKALSCAHRGDWSACISFCEDSIEFVLKSFSEHNSFNNLLRVQPLLLYAHALDHCFRYEQAELTFIEITTNLFPKNARGHLHYALFLKKFNERGEEYMKQLITSLKCNDAQFEEWNEYLHALLNQRDQTTLLLATVDYLDSLNTNHLSVKFKKSFNRQNKLVEQQDKFRLSLQSVAKFRDMQSLQLQCHHEIQCAFIFFLCARVCGKYLKLVDKASILYERASCIEQHFARQMYTGYANCHYIPLMGRGLHNLCITREMCQYFIYTDQRDRLASRCLNISDNTD